MCSLSSRTECAVGRAIQFGVCSSSVRASGPGWCRCSNLLAFGSSSVWGSEGQQRALHSVQYGAGAQAQVVLLVLPIPSGLAEG